jgi:hypothetical protein
MCGNCPYWRAWFCGIKGDCELLKAREDTKPLASRNYVYGHSWTFKDDPCRMRSMMHAA